jgi:hypothetical protein
MTVETLLSLLFKRWRPERWINLSKAGPGLHPSSDSRVFHHEDVPDVPEGEAPAQQLRAPPPKGSYLLPDTECLLLTRSLLLLQLLKKLEQILFLEAVVQMTVIYGVSGSFYEQSSEVLPNLMLGNSLTSPRSDLYNLFQRLLCFFSLFQDSCPDFCQMN